MLYPYSTVQDIMSLCGPTKHLWFQRHTGLSGCQPAGLWEFHTQQLLDIFLRMEQQQKYPVSSSPVLKREVREEQS